MSVVIEPGDTVQMLLPVEAFDRGGMRKFVEELAAVSPGVNWHYMEVHNTNRPPEILFVYRPKKAGGTDGLI